MWYLYRCGILRWPFCILIMLLRSLSSSSVLPARCPFLRHDASRDVGCNDSLMFSWNPRTPQNNKLLTLSTLTIKTARTFPALFCSDPFRLSCHCHRASGLFPNRALCGSCFVDYPRRPYFARAPDHALLTRTASAYAVTSDPSTRFAQEAKLQLWWSPALFASTLKMIFCWLLDLLKCLAHLAPSQERRRKRKIYCDSIFAKNKVWRPFWMFHAWRWNILDLKCEEAVWITHVFLLRLVTKCSASPLSSAAKPESRTSEQALGLRTFAIFDGIVFLSFLFYFFFFRWLNLKLQFVFVASFFFHSASLSF